MTDEQKTEDDFTELHKLYDDAAAAILALKERSAVHQPNFFWLAIAGIDGEEIHVFTNAQPSVAVGVVSGTIETVAQKEIERMAGDGHPLAKLVMDLRNASADLGSSMDQPEPVVPDLPGHVDVGVSER